MKQLFFKKKSNPKWSSEGLGVVIPRSVGRKYPCVHEFGNRTRLAVLQTIGDRRCNRDAPDLWTGASSHHSWDQNASKIGHWEFLWLPLFPETWMEAVASDCHVLSPYIRGGCYSLESGLAVCLRWHMSAGLCVCPWLWVERMECVRCDRLHVTFPNSSGVGMKTEDTTDLARQPYPRYPKIGRTPPIVSQPMMS